MVSYAVIGWYSADPTNPHVAPFARTVKVMASNPEEALDLGAEALDALYVKEGTSVDFLNWFVKEEKS